MTHGNKQARIGVTDGSALEHKELEDRSCLQLEVSPDGAAVACVTPTFGLALRRTEAGELLYSGSVYDSGERHAFPVPIGIETAFSSPFGYVMLDSLEPLANRGSRFIGLAFSPDSKWLLVGAGNSGYRIDLMGRKKFSLPGNVRKHLIQNGVFQKEDRMISLDPEHENQAVVSSAESGAVLTTPSIKADTFELATNKRYALTRRFNETGVSLFDLESDREAEIPANIGADAYGNEVAVLKENGDLYVHRIRETLPIAVTHLPLDRLAAPTSAAVNADLSRFALAASGTGGVFEVTSGRRISAKLPFNAANFADAGSLFLLHPMRANKAREVTRYDVNNGPGTAAWSIPAKSQGSIHPGGSALIEYSWDSPTGRGIVILGQDGIPFRLSALDPGSGKQLWSRTFAGSALPFADPQGEELVLGWNAQSPGAESAARKFPAVWEVFKHTKLAKQDTLFEAIDGRTGKPTGAALVQAGSGAIAYESAFAAGDTLVLVKDHRRISLYSLTDSHLKGRIAGEIPSASAKAGLLAASDESGRLLLYDLQSGERVNELLFFEPIAYTHFSGDGKKLFVLSQYQEAFVLDVEAIRRQNKTGQEN